MNTLSYSERPCDCLYPKCADPSHCALPTIIQLLENLSPVKLTQPYSNGGPMSASFCSCPYPYCAQLSNCAQSDFEQGVFSGRWKSADLASPLFGQMLEFTCDDEDGPGCVGTQLEPDREVTSPHSVNPKDGTGAHAPLPDSNVDFLEGVLPWSGME